MNVFKNGWKVKCRQCVGVPKVISKSHCLVTWVRRNQRRYTNYGVVKQSTAGYTPEHNAFVERWFKTNAEMSRCQMLQYDSSEALWEDSRKMATFITNRVPPTKRIPGEP